MIIQNLISFEGQHCETTATGTLLNNIGIELSEPLLFGIGEGLNFIYWNAKNMGMPFLGGRIKPEQITENICKNCNLNLNVYETSSLKKARANVISFIDKGIPVGLKLDCYHLEYFTNKFHFAAHYVAMYGYDEEYAYLVDTVQQGKDVKTRLENLAKARNEKGPMSSKNLSYTISGMLDTTMLPAIIAKAIKRNAEEYLNPAISNFSYRGIAKAGKELKKWYKTSKSAASEFKRIAIFMEKAGTGGALFRNLYRDFLKESAELLDSDLLYNSYKQCMDIAKKWNKVSDLFNKATEDSINDASCLMIEIAEQEKQMMEEFSYKL